MEESQQGNHKGKGKGKNIEKYKVWSMDESNELLKLMVDAANRGWRDKSGLLSKQTVEKRILPILNAKFGSEWTYKEYTSRLKWFKQRYGNYSKLMRHSSGFGWDPITKKFTATEEVWEDYFKVSFFLFKKYIYRKIMNINTSHFLYVLFIFYFH